MQHVLMDIPEIASYLNLKPSKIRKMVFRKEIPYVKIGRLVRFRRHEIERWLTSLDSGTSGMIKTLGSQLFDSSSLNSGPCRKDRL